MRQEITCRYDTYITLATGHIIKDDSIEEATSLDMMHKLGRSLFLNNLFTTPRLAPYLVELRLRL